jgi:hypothetical protein
MWSRLWTHPLSEITQAGGTREEISIFCLSFSLFLTNVHVYKVGTLVSQIITLAQRQQDSPFLGSVMDSIMHLGFFNNYKGIHP